ncbi:MULTISPECIES: tripartite tricarboxylate transporter substrate-binding protein [unclassified Variovorax]|uniref:tripartite tricarboxylate transporter substrate-binding protein n=1 Tax=unclassified Variovorax TaxID=663243 RepID=UPI002574A0F1|nr:MULTISPECIES: tripartite tricarboxylate transporter substrate-binding protein [unclassified Variovorax]MDM0066973.1 tripartite tricarboxylate transporter substrate-binding protein [Variovorax sp. J31P207]MDM0084672.1 tripartite tricarboxylate transporter substrate-binding protein [Variovorax sp. J31P179]
MFLKGAGAVSLYRALPAFAATPLHVYVGFPPGGATDVIARLVTRQMGGFDAIVDNRAGAGGRLALDAAIRAKNDGDSIVVTPDFPLTVFPHLYRKLTYNPLVDFVPVAMCGVSEFALCVGPAVPKEVTTVGAFLQWCRDNPKKALFASPAPGSTPHFTGVMLATAAKVDLTHVGYKGGTQAMQDLLGGQVPASINPVAEVLPHMGSGKLRVLATTGPERSRFLPDAPTLRESGYRDVVVQSWIAVFAPAGTSEAAATRLEKSINEALKSSAVAEGFAKFGIVVAPMPRQRVAALVQEDLQRWAGVVKASGFVIEE